MTAPEADQDAWVTDSARLRLRELREGDSEFICGLLNEPSFLQYIGERGVRTTDEAAGYIRKGPMASYAAHGFGLWLVLRREDGTPIGMCGLLKREALEDVDIGFAYRPAYWGQGYAVEAGAAVLALAKETFGLSRVVAITQQDNTGSIRVLEKLGFGFERSIEWKGDTEPIRLYARILD